MTGAQMAALELAAAAAQPVRIAPATARVLAQQYGYVEDTGDGWVITDSGRQALSTIHHDRDRLELEQRLTPAARAWAGRVTAWLKAHDRSPSSWQALKWARDVAGCDFDGLQPIAPTAAELHPADVLAVEDEVRMTTRILRDYDAAIALAQERGAAVTVTYNADKTQPQARHDSATAAKRETGAVDLRVYAAKRGRR